MSEEKNTTKSAEQAEEKKTAVDSGTEAKKPAEKKAGSDSKKATSATQKKGKKKKGKVKRKLSKGCVYIKSTYNNTIITFTDIHGNAIAWGSAGHLGFKGPKKATPYAATIITKNTIEKVRDTGLSEVDVFVKGIGGGREAAIRAIAGSGISIRVIRDVTPVPHNGCRPPKPRRV